MTLFPRLTSEEAAAALADAGVACGEVQLIVEPRDERFVVRLPRGRIAFFAASEAGLGRLQRERRILRLLEERCRFGAPRLLQESADGGFDVRAMVPGTSEPWRLYQTVKRERSLAESLGRAIGEILVEQHTRIDASDLAGWLPERPEWPAASDWILGRLPRVVDDTQLIADARRLFDHYDAIGVSDRVLVHADLGFHNLGVDAESLVVYGVFDYDGAALADYHHDFRYLLFDFEGSELLDAACEVYEPATARRVSRGRVALYNAACALSFLALREGVPPHERSCGRTLAEDLDWSTTALRQALSGTG